MLGSARKTTVNGDQTRRRRDYRHASRLAPAGRPQRHSHRRRRHGAVPNSTQQLHRDQPNPASPGNELAQEMARHNMPNMSNSSLKGPFIATQLDSTRRRVELSCVAINQWWK